MIFLLDHLQYWLRFTYPVRLNSDQSWWRPNTGIPHGQESLRRPHLPLENVTVQAVSISRLPSVLHSDLADLYADRQSLSSWSFLSPHLFGFVQIRCLVCIPKPLVWQELSQTDHFVQRLRSLPPSIWFGHLISLSPLSHVSWSSSINTSCHMEYSVDWHNYGYIHTRVCKKPEFLKPAPPLIFDLSRVPDPKKLEV